MMKLWKSIKRLLRSKKPYFLIHDKRESSEELSERINAAVEAKKKQNQRTIARLKRRIRKLEAKVK